MRNCYLLLFCLAYITAFSQNKVSDKKLIVFNTYEDYVAKKGEDYGFITGKANDSWGGNKIYVGNAQKDKAINTNKFWGYQIGGYLFRMNTYSLRVPMLVLNGKEKVFYIDGYLFLDKAIYNEDAGRSFRDSDGCFYSDDLNSEVFEITKMISKEKNNPKLKDMIECLKDAKGRMGVQSKFNGYVECIQK